MSGAYKKASIESRTYA